MNINRENIKFSIVDKASLNKSNQGKSSEMYHLEIKISRELFKNFFIFKNKRIILLNQNAINMTPREIEVLNYMAKGRNNKEIANDLHVARSTAKAHVSSIISKLKEKNRLSAVIKAIKIKLIKI